MRAELDVLQILCRNERGAHVDALYLLAVDELQFARLRHFVAVLVVNRHDGLVIIDVHHYLLVLHGERGVVLVGGERQHWQQCREHKNKMFQANLLKP